MRASAKLSDKDPWMSNKEKAKLVWRFYIPTAGAATATIICIAGVKRLDARKTLAAQAALAVVQQSYSQYRDKVIEEFGEKKDQLILGKVAEDKVGSKPPPAIVAGSGTVVCCELYTGRYFNSDMEALSRAVNELNAKLVRHDYATLDDFYYLIDLACTTISGQIGWTSSRLLELEFSSILHDGRPVLTFDYNYVTTL